MSVLEQTATTKYPDVRNYIGGTFVDGNPASERVPRKTELLGVSGLARVVLAWQLRRGGTPPPLPAPEQCDALLLALAREPGTRVTHQTARHAVGEEGEGGEPRVSPALLQARELEEVLPVAVRVRQDAGPAVTGAVGLAARRQLARKAGRPQGRLSRRRQRSRSRIT